MTLPDLSSRTEPRILVVDDEACVCVLLGRWLSAAGYQFHCAASAADAWNYLQCHPVDLVTTDIRMPGDSGFDLMRRIQEHFPDTAVIMLTGCEDTRLAIQSLSQGAWAYLLKPTNAEMFLLEVEKALKRRQIQIEQRSTAQELESRVCDQSRVIRLSDQETLRRLTAAAVIRDDETGAHIIRVGRFSAVLAEAMGWESGVIDHIRSAAPVHDIGKIGIPDAILRKPAKLTADELCVMKSHTLIGARILSGSDSPMLQLAEQIACSHHEHWDGTGYPNGLAGAAIPPAARIVAIVDVYDALTHDRVYRPALPEDEVLVLLDQGCGTKFDPDAVNTFFASLDAIREIAAEVSEPTPAWTESASAAHEIGSPSLVS